MTSEITISQRAADKIGEVRKEQQIPEEAVLRVSVVSGGCSGLTYQLDFDTDYQPKEEDQHFSDQGIDVIVDMRSFLYLAGTELDYTDGLSGSGFHFNNPNAARTCSCGESFSL